MSYKYDGGQAFPRGGYDGPDNHDGAVDGMPLRDYFAAKAMQGMLSEGTLCGPGDHQKALAEIAYDYADAMLKARGR